MDKNSSTYKTILLSVVCALAGACLAAANAVTKPIIEENAIAAVKTTLDQFYPGASFTDVTTKYVTSEYTLVDGVYEAEGKGYIFTLHNTGYSSSGFKFAIAFNTDGTIAGYMALEQNETSGKGSLAFEQNYIDQVTKLTSSDDMPLISGATITTTAVKNAVAQAEAIFNQIEGITASPSATAAATASAASSGTLGETNFSSQNASCKVSSEGVYSCQAKGFNGTVTATVTVKDGAIVSITDLAGADDGDGVGDDLFKDGALSSYAGATLKSTVDVESGATYTSKAIQAMAAAALNGGTASTSTSAATASASTTSGATASSGATAKSSSSTTTSDTLGTGDYTSANASCTASSDGVYACKATGFSNAAVSATITVKDGAIVSITDLTGADKGDGVGDTWYSDASVFNGATLDSSIDAMSGATYTSKAVKGMAAAALNAAAGK